MLLAPFAPHIAEELWHVLGHDTSVCDATYPEYDPECLVEKSHEYPVSVNGKVRAKKQLALDASREEIEKDVLADPTVAKWLDGKTPKKVIIVPGKIINIVV